jgi:GH43 family beta-xylosidase
MSVRMKTLVTGPAFVPEAVSGETIHRGIYHNPVYPHSFPDPFILKHRGEYWGYCTGLWQDGRAFGVIRSWDLVNWRPLAGALELLPEEHPHYWAPEVSYFEGRFYLYYSVGNEERMEIRVAVADHPAGPFLDSGRKLTHEPFAIDAHVFADVDGSRWLFYATDFLDRSHVGTGTVRDRLWNPLTLEGNPRPVALPRHDWHVYHPNRPEKGGVRWHTVEGPFVMRRKGVYYEMFSGGNWQNPTYGVSFAKTRDLSGTAEWEQADLPILRSGGEVVGPGHNSAVRGPDNRQLWCVYHRWSAGSKERVLAIDPLDWAGERMLVLGPTTAPRPAPNAPTITDLTGEPAVIIPGEEIRYETGTPSFLVEVSVRGDFSVGLGDQLRIAGSAAFFRLLRIEADGLRVTASLDEEPPFLRQRIADPVTAISLANGEFSAFSLTAGWEDLFEEDGDPAALGWEGEGWRVEQGRLRGEGTSWIFKGPTPAGFLAVINARLESPGGEYFFVLGDEGPRIALKNFPIPPGFDPGVDQQFRLRKEGKTVEVSWEGLLLGTVEAPPGPLRLGLGTADARASFEMVRVTATSPSGSLS